MAAAEQAELATSEEVAQAAALAREHRRLGIDTEFMSEGRYRALLCVVQIAVDDPQRPENPRILLIDSLADTEIRPLAELLADPGIEVILHAGRQDVAILRRAWRTELTNIFDTQIAAGFAGASAQAGYGNLLSSVLRRRVDKTASYTRWDARPLTEEQLSYAAEDVVHLFELSDELERRLGTSGRLDWAREECRRLESATDERDPETAWERLPRIGQLDPRARAVARELAAWRERTASAEDRPVGSVLADAPLVELAKRQPRTNSSIEQIRIAGLGAGAGKAGGYLSIEDVGELGAPGSAQDRCILSAGVQHHLDGGIGQQAGQRRRVHVGQGIDQQDLRFLGLARRVDDDLHEAEERPVAALGHELRVDTESSASGGGASRPGHIS